MANAQTIQIFLPKGDPSGIRVASLTTRTVRVFEVPRSLLRDFLEMSESNQVGVYYLFGSEPADVPQCYIGQSGSVGERLKQHTGQKEFWTKALVAVSLTNEWTSTHVAYLEWLSINRAKQYGRFELQNGNAASNPFTPAPLEADCREFLDTIAVLLATLGAPILEPVLKTSNAGDGRNTIGEPASEVLYFKEGGCRATGHQTPEGLLVAAGSRGRPEVRDSAYPSISRRRDALQAEGVVTIDTEGLIFVKDYLFNSPSMAGTVLIGGNINGRNSWKDSLGNSINDLERAALDSVPKTSVAQQNEIEFEK
ncbi:GIY-YIG nuclease family protein [Rhodococcus sp. IEGM 1241]|uniref:GIY-YIG nuclease family protein n=1 Tax=Rhodococcus sp. IEGM 1241 TaxID=3082228 RepID=UPI0029533A5F|nr:GIY-YIG nuclease family protein [Rhodococcus sp. IEGM 1241]MDV8011662.1 GIY-YIG nuclease family protein [Rhodococcus sp. IEGM 1241]